LAKTDLIVEIPMTGTHSCKRVLPERQFVVLQKKPNSFFRVLFLSILEAFSLFSCVLGFNLIGENDGSDIGSKKFEQISKFRKCQFKVLGN